MKTSNNTATGRNRLRTSLLRFLVKSVSTMAPYELTFGYMRKGQYSTFARHLHTQIPTETVSTTQLSTQFSPDESEWGWI